MCPKSQLFCYQIAAARAVDPAHPRFPMVALYVPGWGEPQEGPEWDALSKQVEAEALRAIAACGRA